MKIYLRVDQENTLVYNKISPNKLIEGGQPILSTHNKKVKAAEQGIIDINPWIKYILRLPTFSYTMLIKENKPADTIPWETISTKAPSHPILKLVYNPLINKPICPTEEYAIKDLMSLWRIQIIEVIKAPYKEITKNLLQIV